MLKNKVSLVVLASLILCLSIPSCVDKSYCIVNADVKESTESIYIRDEKDSSMSLNTVASSKTHTEQTSKTTSTPETEPIHTHVFSDATCTSPATCSCGETQGNANGHNWKDATCTNAKTCSDCGITEGTALGHSWNNATCTSPSTCSVCGATDGSAAGHSWSEATCTTPASCSVCGTTNGGVAGHNWSGATCTSPNTCSVCGATDGGVTGHSFYNGSCTSCGEIDSSYQSQGMVWIPTKGGKKYHTNASCSNMDDPNYVSLSEAEALGFTACKKCH